MIERATVLGLFLVVVLGGCSHRTTIEGMKLADPDPLRQQPYSVRVAAEGGAETSRGDGAGAISDEDLKQAIEASIRSSGLFAEVVVDGTADYLLRSTLVHVRKPVMGFTMDVAMEAVWTLKDLRADKGVWRETVQSTYTADTGDAFAGGARLRMATEGAVRDNIAIALRRIAELELQPLATR